MAQAVGLSSMKRVETYRWRVQWVGKWKTTRHHASEEDIRVEHPEAQRVDGTLIVRMLPETESERAEQLRHQSFNPYE